MASVDQRLSATGAEQAATSLATITELDDEDRIEAFKDLSGRTRYMRQYNSGGFLGVDVDVEVQPSDTVGSTSIQTAGAKLNFNNIAAPPGLLKGACVQFTVTTASSVVPVPGPLLFQYVEVYCNGQIVQTMQGEDLFFAYDQLTAEQLAKAASAANFSATWGAPTAIATSTRAYAVELYPLCWRQTHVLSGADHVWSIRFYWRGGTQFVESGTTTDVTVSLASLRLHMRQLPAEEYARQLAKYRSVPIDHRILRFVQTSVPLTVVSGSAYKVQQSNANGLSPAVYYCLRASLSGSGLRTFAAVTSLDMQDASSNSLTGGVPQTSLYNLSIEAQASPGTMQSNLNVYRLNLSESPFSEYDKCRLEGGQVLTGREQFYFVAAASTSYTIDIYCVQHALLILSPGGGVQII